MAAVGATSPAAARSGTGEVRVEAVTSSIIDRRGAAIELVHDCSFSAQRSDFTVLVGPSGCGKTTLMNLIAGYTSPDTGAVLLDGAEVRGPSWERLMVFQETALFPWMTTLANVTYGPRVRRAATHRDVATKASRLLARFGLAEFEGRYPHELSGGMQRRAELARALINDPLVMLMDEPFRGLDAMTRQLMQEYLVRLFEEIRTTTIFVTSEIDEAIFLADKVIVLSRAPASVASTIVIDLPRPRSFEMFASGRYRELKSQVLELLYEEAASAFESGGQPLDLKESFERRHG
jgi:NitT/TauT family transport system ATP-binding protein